MQSATISACVIAIQPLRLVTPETAPNTLGYAGFGPAKGAENPARLKVRPMALLSPCMPHGHHISARSLPNETCIWVHIEAESRKRGSTTPSCSTQCDAEHPCSWYSTTFEKSLAEVEYFRLGCSRTAVGQDIPRLKC